MPRFFSIFVFVGAACFFTFSFPMVGRAQSFGEHDPRPGTLHLTGPTTTSFPSQTSSELDPVQVRESIDWLAQLALTKLPETIKGDKHWGETKEVWAGVKVRLDGIKLKTKRKKREVNHGQWIQYELKLPEPDNPKGVSVVIDRAAVVELKKDDHSTPVKKLAVASTLVAPLQFSARIQRWNYGIKLYSVSAKGRLRVRFTSEVRLGVRPDLTEVPPAIVIDPEVINAKLELESFEVDRVSRVGGDVAEAWGEVLQEVLVERFVKRTNEKLVAKLNRSIDKNRKHLRGSMSDWLSQLTLSGSWGE